MMAVVELILSMYETLSSVPSTNVYTHTYTPRKRTTKKNQAKISIIKIILMIPPLQWSLLSYQFYV